MWFTEYACFASVDSRGNAAAADYVCLAFMWFGKAVNEFDNACGFVKSLVRGV